MTSFFNAEELQELGLANFGTNVLLSRKCSLYGAEKISLGSNVRIDDFCILSGNITLGDHSHIAAYTAMFAGKYKIEFGNYSGTSSRCVVYAENDDYSGESLVNPTNPPEYCNTYGGDVIIGSHVVFGSGCIILPNITIADGVAVGAMSLVSKSLPAWGIYAGIPCRKLKERSKKLLEYACQ